MMALLYAFFGVAQQPQYPIIQDYGGIYEIPGGIKPDKDIHYQIVIDLKNSQPLKGQVNRGLNNIARMINLHGLGGVPKENIHVAAAVHGGATEIVLNNEAYRAKHGMDNPNLGLIKALKDGGVVLYVCGQSLLGRGYAQDQVNKDITIGLSMLTVVTTHLHKGYKLLVFD